MPKAAMAITVAAMARMPVSESDPVAGAASTGAAVLSAGAGAAAGAAGPIFTVACGAGRAGGVTCTLAVSFFETDGGGAVAGLGAAGAGTAAAGMGGLGAATPAAAAADAVVA